MRKFITYSLFILLLTLTLSACKQKSNFSDCEFINISWTRACDNDTEFICFHDNGEFSYYCACGNPVNDSDLCEGFSYNHDTKTITLDYSEKTKETVTKVIVKKCTDEELVLDFDGDIRSFSKEKEQEGAIDKLTYEGKEYALIEYNSDIFNYDLTMGGDYEEDEIHAIKHDKWDIIYYNGDLFALKSDLEEVNAYYRDDKNYNWWVRVEDINLETQYTRKLSPAAEEIEYLYAMDEMERDETIFFEEINQFATFAKTSKDGLITATIELVWHNNYWYWRSEIIDESREGWPEYIFKLPESLNERIVPPHNSPS